MEVNILSQQGGMATVRVTLPPRTITEALDQVYAQHRKDESFSLPRQGIDTDPQGQALFQEAVRSAFSDAYAEAIRASGLQVASEPKVTVVRASEARGAEYDMTFALRPELKLGRYKGIRVAMPEMEPTEEEIRTALEAAAKQNTAAVDVDRPAAPGDTAVIDFKGFLDGEAFAGGEGADYPLTLGSGQFIPGFEEQLVGAVAGDHVDVHVTFPEGYHAENLRGRDAVFQVQVKKVQERQLRPLTAEQESQARSQAAQRKRELADQQIEDQVLSVILSEAQVELPEAMIDSEANICLQQFAAELSTKGMTIEQFSQSSGKTLAEMRKEMHPLARRRIELRLVLSAIAKAEDITATEEEVDRYWDQMAAQYGIPKAQLQQMMAPETAEELRAEIIGQKAYAFLRESTILQRPGSAPAEA